MISQNFIIKKILSILVIDKNDLESDVTSVD